MEFFLSYLIKSQKYFCFRTMVLASVYRMIESFSLSGNLILVIFHSLSIKSLLYFLKIMCKLDSKYNRKMYVFKKRPIFPHSLLHYKVDIFSFSSLSLISDFSTSERFLKSQRVCPHFFSTSL